MDANNSLRHTSDWQTQYPIVFQLYKFIVPNATFTICFTSIQVVLQMSMTIMQRQRQVMQRCKCSVVRPPPGAALYEKVGPLDVVLVQSQLSCYLLLPYKLPAGRDNWLAGLHRNLSQAPSHVMPWSIFVSPHNLLDRVVIFALIIFKCT